MSESADSEPLPKDIPVNWENIMKTTTDEILAGRDEDVQESLRFMRRLRIQESDPDCTVQNLSHLFVLTQFCLEFPFIHYFLLLLLFLFLDWQ